MAVYISRESVSSSDRALCCSKHFPATGTLKNSYREPSGFHTKPTTVLNSYRKPSKAPYRALGCFNSHEIEQRTILNTCWGLHLEPSVTTIISSAGSPGSLACPSSVKQEGTQEATLREAVTQRSQAILHLMNDVDARTCRSTFI